jgi:hypothetical protein
MRYLPILITLTILVAGCAGELDFSKVSTSTTTTVDSSTVSAPWPDLGNTPTSDAGAGSADGAAATSDGGTAQPDSIVPDTKPAPDTKPPPDTGPVGVGQACPCSGETVCISGVCRAKCNAPTGACKVTSNCPTDHACLGTTAGTYVCMPASKPGAACGTSNYCPINHVCGATGSNPYKCLPICAVSGGACGTGGGKCVKAATGCMFCSAP